MFASPAPVQASMSTHAWVLIEACSAAGGATMLYLLASPQTRKRCFCPTRANLFPLQSACCSICAATNIDFLAVADSVDGKKCRPQVFVTSVLASACSHIHSKSSTTGSGSKNSKAVTPETDRADSYHLPDHDQATDYATCEVSLYVGLSWPRRRKLSALSVWQSLFVSARCIHQWSPHVAFIHIFQNSCQNTRKQAQSGLVSSLSAKT